MKTLKRDIIETAILISIFFGMLCFAQEELPVEPVADQPVVAEESPYMVIIARSGLDCEVIRDSIIGECYVRGPSGTVYVFGYCKHWAGIPDTETHININVKDLTPELVSVIPSLPKAVTIHGVGDPWFLMRSIGMVLCNADGSDIAEVL